MKRPRKPKQSPSRDAHWSGQDAPDLKDRDLWAQFPAEDYDMLIVDSVGASTEGITEKEGKQNSEVLATLLDLAHRDIAILLLQNTEKTGTNIRGRGEWADRADIQYEVRDATGFTPSGRKPWWIELPQDGAANWAERAARRKGRTVFRLAFISAKFRLREEYANGLIPSGLLRGGWLGPQPPERKARTDPQRDPDHQRLATLGGRPFGAD